MTGAAESHPENDRNTRLTSGRISTLSSLFENNHLPINDTESCDPAIHLFKITPRKESYPEMA
jgi:hypothetical protein